MIDARLLGIRICNLNVSKEINIIKKKLKKVVCTAFAIPASQAKFERIFLLMNLYWSDVRNKSSLSLIKSELGVNINKTRIQPKFRSLLKLSSHRKNTNFKFVKIQILNVYFFCYCKRRGRKGKEGEKAAASRCT